MSFISVDDGIIVNSAHIVAIFPNAARGGCDLVMDDARTFRVTQRSPEQLVKIIEGKA
jgi:hypothetical protein